MNRIAEPGQGKSRNVFATKLVEDGLPFTKMLKTRRRNRQLEQVTLARIRIHVHQALGILERQAAQKKIVDQTEDGSVQADPQRERDNRNKTKRRRLPEFAKGKANVVHKQHRYSLRNTSTGSTRAARRAGSQHATVADTAKTIPATKPARRFGAGIAVH